MTVKVHTGLYDSPPARAETALQGCKLLSARAETVLQGCKLLSARAETVL